LGRLSPDVGQGALHLLNDFLSYILFAQLALLNVVTGIFVDSSQNAAKSDKQMMIQEEMLKEGLHKAELEKIFYEASDRENYVSVSRMRDYLMDEHVKAYLRFLGVTYSQPQEVVKVLDEDQSDSIDAEEFVRGCMMLKSIHVTDVQSHLNENRRLLEDLHRQNCASSNNSQSVLQPKTNQNFGVELQLNTVTRTANGVQEGSTPSVLNIHEGGLPDEFSDLCQDLHAMKQLFEKLCSQIQATHVLRCKDTKKSAACSEVREFETKAGDSPHTPLVPQASQRSSHSSPYLGSNFWGVREHLAKRCPRRLQGDDDCVPHPNFSVCVPDPLTTAYI